MDHVTETLRTARKDKSTFLKMFCYIKKKMNKLLTRNNTVKKNNIGYNNTTTDDTTGKINNFNR